MEITDWIIIAIIAYCLNGKLNTIRENQERIIATLADQQNTINNLINCTNE